MTEPANVHQSYLLRLRYVDNAGDPRWVITLEVPGSGRQERVPDLQTLMEVLNEKMLMMEKRTADLG